MSKRGPPLKDANYAAAKGCMEHVHYTSIQKREPYHARRAPPPIEPDGAGLAKTINLNVHKQSLQDCGNFSDSYENPIQTNSEKNAILREKFQNIKGFMSPSNSDQKACPAPNAPALADLTFKCLDLRRCRDPPTGSAEMVNQANIGVEHKKPTKPKKELADIEARVRVPPFIDGSDLNPIVKDDAELDRASLPISHREDRMHVKADLTPPETKRALVAALLPYEVQVITSTYRLFNSYAPGIQDGRGPMSLESVTASFMPPGTEVREELLEGQPATMAASATLPITISPQPSNLSVVEPPMKNTRLYEQDNRIQQNYVPVKYNERQDAGKKAGKEKITIETRIVRDEDGVQPQRNYDTMLGSRPTELRKMWPLGSPPGPPGTLSSNDPHRAEGVLPCPGIHCPGCKAHGGKVREYIS